jgi:hypothetical protein
VTLTRPNYRFTSVPERTIRRLRQNAGTVYHQLLAAGFTAEDIAAASEQYPRTRRISLATTEQDGSSIPVVAVAYGGDLRAEEEYGIPEISKALLAGEHAKRVFTGEVDGRWYLGLHADRGLNRWEQQEIVARRAAEAQRRAQIEAQDEHWRDRFLKVQELRDGLRAAGVDGPLPRTKTELQSLFAAKVRTTRPYVSVGEFHYGDTLIMLPAEPILEAALRILAGAGKHLRMGGSSSPFGRGAYLFDDRDLTGETIEADRVHEDYVRRMAKKAKPVWDTLATKGQVFAISPGRRENGKDLFWLNYYPHGFAQQFGWYTLDDMLSRHRDGTWPARR